MPLGTCGRYGGPGVGEICIPVYQPGLRARSDSLGVQIAVCRHSEIHVPFRWTLDSNSFSEVVQDLR
ncbi:MAG: hypothetical protein JWN70_6180 [Planctomycetaceae bacterium]|nr:hypothetical protein [Planctomycetaceae bacterium]